MIAKKDTFKQPEPKPKQEEFFDKSAPKPADPKVDLQQFDSIVKEMEFFPDQNEAPVEKE